MWLWRGALLRIATMSEAAIAGMTIYGKLVAGIRVVITTGRKSLVVIEKGDGCRRISKTRLLGIKGENLSLKFSEIRKRRILSEDGMKHEVIRAKTMKSGNDQVLIKNRLVNRNQSINNWFSMMEIGVNRLSAFIEIKKLHFEIGCTSYKLLGKMTFKAVLNCLWCVEANGKLCNVFC